MEEKIKALKEKISNDFKEISNLEELEKIRLKYMGKKGEVVELLKNLKDVAQEEKKEFGNKVNLLKSDVLEKIEGKKKELREKEYEDKINNSKIIDLTLPTEDMLGSLHPITIVQKELEDIFISMGFSVEDGNEVETEYNNFEAVNVPKFHPARDMQDTYWLENGQLLKVI